jgi:hypothetical protein
VYYEHSKDSLEWIEVAIPVQQGVSATQAEGGNPVINRFAHCVALPPEPSEIPRRRHGQLHAARLENFELAQFALDARERASVADTLQDLAEIQICQSKALAA